MQLFGFGAVLANKILGVYYYTYFYTFFAYFLLALSTYVLFKQWLGHKSAALVASTMLVCSPIIYIYFTATTLIYAIVFLNFVMYFLSRIYQSENGKIKWSWIFLCVLSLTLANIYIQFFVLIGVVGLLFAIFNYKTVWRKRATLSIHAILIALWYLLINAQWIYVLYVQLADSGSEFIKSVTQSTVDIAVLQATSSLTRLSDAIRLVPYHYVEGQSPLRYFNINVWLQWLSYLIPLAALMGLIVAPKVKKLPKYFALALIIIFLPLINGAKGFSQQYFMYLWNHMPFFQTFRTLPKFLFIVTYSYMFLICLTLIFVLNKYRRYRLAIMALFIFLACFPIFLYRTSIRQQFLQKEIIPQSYFQINNFQPEPSANAIAIPQTNWLVTYDWRSAGKDYDNILPYFYNGAIMANGASYGGGSEWQAYNGYVGILIKNNDFATLKYLLPYKNVHYLILQKDIQPYINYSEQDRQNTIANLENSGFPKVWSNGEIEIFEVPSEESGQKIYSAQTLVNLSPERDIIDLNAFTPFIIPDFSKRLRLNGPVYVFNNNTTGGDQILSKKVQFTHDVNDCTFDVAASILDSGNVSYEKDDDLNYKIHLNQVKGSAFGLVFAEQYSKGWELQNNGRPISAVRHIEANNYSNLFLVDINSLCLNSNICRKNMDGSYDLDLDLSMAIQNKYLYLFYLSIASLCAGFALVIYEKIRHKTSKK